MKPSGSFLSKLIHFERHADAVSEDEVTGQLVDKKGGRLFLGRYSLDAVTRLLEKRGIIGDIRSQGFDDLLIDIDTSDPYHHRLTLHHDLKDADHLLGEIRISEGTFKPRNHFVPEVRLDEVKTIVIEWIGLQNPRTSFTPRRPRLPGQAHPGLGVARKVLALLVDLAQDLHKDGILNFPQYYHNAAIYSEIFLFYNPIMQGKLYAMIRDLRPFPLDKVSQAILDGRLRDRRTQETQGWVAEEQILPVSLRTQDYFNSESYKKLRDEAAEMFSYDIEWDTEKT